MRQATVETRVPYPILVASALRPDHTDDIRTEVTNDVVRTTIERPGTASLQSTTDDYLVNLQVAINLHDAITNRYETESNTTTATKESHQ